MRISAEQCAEVIAIIERIRDDLPTVYELDKRMGLVERPDGFRTSVRPMDGSRASTDADGEPLPPHSDPTGSTAVILLEGRCSSVREEVKLLNACMTEIRGLANQADGARDRAMLPDGKTLDPEQCEVHRRHGQGFMAVHRAGRCRWCYDFWLVEGVDAPADLLKAYGEGRRITQQMVAEALKHQPTRFRKHKAG